MFSYQHIYHAGNMADVQKHLWLLTVMEYLARKDKPYIWIDTHSGRGLYDLQSAEAQKIKEYESGILKVMARIQSSDNPILQLYSKAIGGGDLKTYPGSAYLAAKMLRAEDKLYAYEMHPKEFEFLSANLKDFKNTKSLKEDGYKGLKSLMPPSIRRGGVLIDPSFEVKEEYDWVASAVSEAYKKWPQGVYMIWYPILAAGRHEAMCEGLAKISDDFVRDEWMFNGVEKGMLGSGMFVINPPYTCAETMDEMKASIV